MNTPTEQEFEKDGIHVKVKPQKKCIYQFDVTIPAESIENLRQNVIRAIAKEVSVPGFRKGKAPSNFIVQHYQSAIAKELEEQIVSFATLSAIDLSSVKMSGRDTQYQKFEVPATGSLTVTINFEGEGEVPSVDLEKIEITTTPFNEITDTDAEDFHHYFLYSTGLKKEVTDRPIKDRDIIVVDIEDLKENTTDMDQSLLVSKGHISSWTYEAVLGKNIGDSIEGEGFLDPDASEEAKEDYKPGNYRITIKKIFEADPSENERMESIFRMYSVENESALKELWKKNLQDKADSDRKVKLKKKVVDVILENHPFEVPLSTTITFANQVLRQMISNNEKFLATLGKEQVEEKINRFRAVAMEEGEKIAAIELLLKKLKQEHNIEISTEELSDAFNKQMRMMQFFSEKEFKSMKGEKLRNTFISFKNDQEMNRTLDFLLEKAKYV